MDYLLSNLRRIFVFIFLLILISQAYIPSVVADCGPDYIITGQATYNGEPLTSDSGYLVTIYNEDNVLLASSEIIDYGAYGYWYVLRIPTEDGSGGVECGNPTGTKDEPYYLYINGVPVEENPVDISEIDESTRQIVLPEIAM